jgi:hypothetical protein
MIIASDKITTMNDVLMSTDIEALRQFALEKHKLSETLKVSIERDWQPLVSELSEDVRNEKQSRLTLERTLRHLLDVVGEEHKESGY